MIINGPNMNMLGIREPAIYGRTDYAALEEIIKNSCASHGVDCELYQSNHEGDIVDAVQRAYFESFDGIIINPAAYTHTSVAIADALSAVRIPTVEVHISDTDSREEFRKISYVSPVAVKTIKGHGIAGYSEAVDFLYSYIEFQKNS